MDTLLKLGIIHLYLARAHLLKNSLQVDFMYNGFNYLIRPAPREYRNPIMRYHQYTISEEIMNTQTN